MKNVKLNIIDYIIDIILTSKTDIILTDIIIDITPVTDTIIEIPAISGHNIKLNRDIGLMSRVFANVPREQGSIQG